MQRNELMRRVARVVCERHGHDSVGIYLPGPDGDDVSLAGWPGDPENLEGCPRESDHLTFLAARDLDMCHVRDGLSWSVTAPRIDDDSLLGVLLIVSRGPEMEEADARRLGSTLVWPIDVGIRMVRLRLRLTNIETSEEWERSTHVIHDGILGSMYSLALHLETYAEMEGREANSLSGRMDYLVPHTRSLLLDTRSYLYHALPVLRGQSGLVGLVEGLSMEYEIIAETPLRPSVSGDDRHVQASVGLGLHRVLPCRLGNLPVAGTASGVEADVSVEVDVSMESDAVSLTVSDDGSMGNLDREGRLAGETRGSLEMVDSGREGSWFTVERTIG